MKIEEKIKLAKLYDAYKPLLSKGQIDVIEQYLSYDLTISEIAENLGISRQAVLDSITKAEKKLVKFEEELSFVERIDKLMKELEIYKNKKG